MAFAEVTEIKSNPKQIPSLEKIVDQRVDSIIEDFHLWDSQLNKDPHCPIRWSEKTVKGLRKYADQMIVKASLKKKGDYAREQFITAAVEARASAYRKEYEEDRPRREREAAEESKARTAREKHEQALKPNGARIAKLQKIIKDASVAEQSLAQLYRALNAHKAAEKAREELQQIKGAAATASVALGQKAPVIDIPRPDYAKDAAELALIFYRAMNSMAR